MSRRKASPRQAVRHGVLQGAAGRGANFILEARRQTARMVDAGLTLLYWQIGDRIRREILRDKRAGTVNGSFPRWGDNWNTSSAGDFPRIPAPHDPLCRSLPRVSDCLDAVETIGLESLPEIIYLRNDLQPTSMPNCAHGALERAHAPVSYPVHALRAHRPLEEARTPHRERAERPAGKTGSQPICLPRSYVLDFLACETRTAKRLEHALLREIESFLLELAVVRLRRAQKRIPSTETTTTSSALYHGGSAAVSSNSRSATSSPPMPGRLNSICAARPHERQEGKRSPRPLL